MFSVWRVGLFFFFYVKRLELQPLCTTVRTEVTHYTAYYAERWRFTRKSKTWIKFFSFFFSFLFLAPISLIVSWPRRALGRCSPVFHLLLDVNFWKIWCLFILMFSVSWLIISCGLFLLQVTTLESCDSTLYIHYIIISIRYPVNANWFCLVCPTWERDPSSVAR